jgi:hypothetical protein
MLGNFFDVLAETGSTATATLSCSNGIFPVLNSPELAGLFSEILSLQRRPKVNRPTQFHNF